MLRLTKIEEGACYVSDTTKLYVAWSMLCSSSKLFWDSPVIKELDKVTALIDQAFGEKPEMFSELVNLLQNNENSVLTAFRIITCFENYFKGKLLLNGYLIHEMNLKVCQRNYSQFVAEIARSQKTKPILIDDVKQIEKHDLWSTESLITLTNKTIGLDTLLRESKYREIYLEQTPDDQRLLSVLRSLKEARNNLHFLSALVHKSKNRRNLSIWKPELGNRVTFRHAQMGHFVERQATDQCLSGLSSQ